MPKKEAKYIDAFVLVIKKDKVAAYRKIAREAKKMWLKYGALSYRECIGDDLAPNSYGVATLPFPKLTKLQADETVWFSYIEYASKAERNRVNKRVMKDMEDYQKDHPDHMKDMPFDMKRMSFGGFKIAV